MQHRPFLENVIAASREEWKSVIESEGALPYRTMWDAGYRHLTLAALAWSPSEILEFFGPGRMVKYGKIITPYLDSKIHSEGECVSGNPKQNICYIPNPSLAECVTGEPGVVKPTDKESNHAKIYAKILQRSQRRLWEWAVGSEKEREGFTSSAWDKESLKCRKVLTMRVSEIIKFVKGPSPSEFFFFFKNLNLFK